MKKLKFNIRKGFTLVECIIAIAVFAIMTSMVLMIMASTVKLSKRASESEAGLNQLVQNVVQDSSNKTYSTHDSKTLNMKFSGAYSADFAMSYSTVDGARNMFRCPSCGYEANSMEFLNYLYSHPDYISASDADKKRYKLTHWFDPAASGKNHYECPECGTATNIASVSMKCISCEKTGAATAFIYDSVNGGFACPDCNSGKVVQLDATSGLPINQDMVNTNYDFKISSIQSNAIRYAHIEEPTDDDRKKFMSISSPSSPDTDTFTMQLDYAPSTVAQAVGVYTLRISGINHFESGDTATISITLPGAYVCNLIPDTKNSNTKANVPGGTVNASKPTVTWTAPEGNEYANTGKRSKIVISNITALNTSDVSVAFTLTNYKNNQSFEDDYDTEGGLMKYWFGHSGNTMNFTNPPPEPAGP